MDNKKVCHAHPMGVHTVCRAKYKLKGWKEKI